MRSKLPLIGGAAALLAGAGIVAAIWSNGTNSVACAGPKHAPVPPAAQQALAAYGDRIQHETESSGNGSQRDETWFDPVSGRRRQVSFDASGKIETEFDTIRQGNSDRMTVVLYAPRRWFTSEHRLPASVEAQNSAAAFAQVNRDTVADGKAKIIGREMIDGRQTLHLHETVHPVTDSFGVPQPPSPPSFAVDTWVDPLTYLTIRRRTRFGEVATVLSTDDIWLPRTPANIAKTKVVIPAGFTHDQPQQGNGFGIGFVQHSGKNCQ